MAMTEYVTGKTLTGEDIRWLREVLGLTQKELSVFLRCSKRTVENWESNAREITGPIVPLAEILLRQPELVKKLELPPPGPGLRIWYYYRSIVCSVIDVNEAKRTVSVRNYISNPQYRAFGVNTEPSFEDYQAFLESRCFPRSRDKMKLQLKELDLPFYDPIMIIEKTDGRMAGDEFWLRIERCFV